MNKKYRDQQGRAIRFRKTRWGVKRAKKAILRLQMGMFSAQNYNQVVQITRSKAETKEQKLNKSAAIARLVIKDAQQKVEQLNRIRQV